jgi:hypothetical protein
LKLQDGVKKWEGDDDDDNDSQKIQHAQSMAKSEVTTLASPRSHHLMQRRCSSKNAAAKCSDPASG